VSFDGEAAKGRARRLASRYANCRCRRTADLALMRQNDELHLEHPFAGSRMLRDMLKRESHPIGRKHVATLMKKMRIEALYKKPNTSGRHRVHPVYPYLLRNMEITRPNRVFVADITYIPIKRGFVYLFVAMAEICLCNGTATVAMFH
jgi:putative transposase